jgi:hypothetical protein
MANNYTDASISPPLPASLFSQAEIESLEAACNVVCHRDGDALHLFGEMCFSTEGEDEEGREVNLLTLLQSKLRQLDAAAYPHITIQAACYSDKKRPDEFGGFAYLITRDQIHSISTWEWLETQIGPNPLDHRTIRIEVRGGVVQEVSNIPPGWEYEIIDHDNLEANGQAGEA